jgi:predicted hydrocarbon binding protein
MTLVTKTDNFLMRTYLMTVQTVLGPNGLKSILNYSHLKEYIDSLPPDNNELEIPVEEVQALFRSLTELFGGKGARGLQLRVGREISRTALEGRPGIAKTMKLAVKFVPEATKMRLALQKLADQVKESYDTQLDVPPVELKEEPDAFFIIHRVRFESEGVTSETPVCNVFVGMIQYFMEWITGHPHDVEELECKAMGHPADVFRVSKAAKE